MTDLSKPNQSIDDKIYAATRTEAPRPEFLETLGARLAEQPQAAQPPHSLQSFAGWLAAGFRKPVLALGVVTIFLLGVVFLVVGPQRVFAAVGGLFGYIPGIGLVQNGAGLSVLAEPVSVQRQGITLTIEQAAADSQHTIVVYKVEGLSLEAANSQGEVAATGGPATLLLPDGAILSQMAGGGPGWGSGYEMRLVFPALPAGANQVTLTILRLISMPSGAAPEDWRIPFQFKPAPADLQVMPVYELSTPQTASVLTTKAASQAGGTTQPVVAAASVTPEITQSASSNDAFHNGIHFRLDKVIDLGNGYQLQGVLTWDGQLYANVSIDPYGFPYSLSDAAGQPIRFEEVEPDTSGNAAGGSSVAWALKTNLKSFASPVEISVAGLQAYQTIPVGQSSFQIDFGSSPQQGQTWSLDQDLQVAGKTVRAVSAILASNPRDGNLVLEVTFKTDPNVSGLGIIDPANQPDANQSAGSGGGGGGGPAATAVPGVFSNSIPLYHKPVGLHQIQITDISYRIDGPWTVRWNAPAVNQQVGSTQPAPACLTSAKWQSIKDQSPAALPGGLSGRLLVEENTGQLMPQLSLLNLDGSQRKVLAIGGWSDLSPDGKTAAFIESDGPGLMLLDVANGKKQIVPGTGSQDYHPVWSPDATWLAFVRGASGIFVIRPDGTGLRQVADAARIRSLVGWLPDGKSLVITSLGANGSQVQRLDLGTGQLVDLFNINNVKGGFVQLSPDGKRVSFSEMTFGLPSYGIYVANLDGTGKRLVAELESGGASAGAWSPDNQWLGMDIKETTAGVESERTLLLQVDTCQAWHVPGAIGKVTGWAAALP